MSRWWQKIAALDALQWRYLTLSLVLLPAIDVSLRWVGFKRTKRWLEARVKSPEAKAGGNAVEATALQIAAVVSLAGRRSLWPTSCLRQALALWILLANRGIKSEVRVGVEATAGSGFAAHAWVERNDRVLIGGEHARERYVTLL